MDRPRHYDYYICATCGLEFDRRSEFQMAQVENHQHLTMEAK